MYYCELPDPRSKNGVPTFADVPVTYGPDICGLGLFEYIIKYTANNITQYFMRFSHMFNM